MTFVFQDMVLFFLECKIYDLKGKVVALLLPVTGFNRVQFNGRLCYEFKKDQNDLQFVVALLFTDFIYSF